MEARRALRSLFSALCLRLDGDFLQGDFVRVPCGIVHFSKEQPFPPRQWVERGYNIEHWTEMSTEGHFAASEEPELLAEDIRDFFRPLRTEIQERGLGQQINP